MTEPRPGITRILEIHAFVLHRLGRSLAGARRVRRDLLSCAGGFNGLKFPFWASGEIAAKVLIS